MNKVFCFVLFCLLREQVSPILTVVCHLQPRSFLVQDAWEEGGPPGYLNLKVPSDFSTALCTQ